MAKMTADSKTTKSTDSTKKKKGGIKKYFKDFKAELKRVTWPSRKQVVNNTGIVLTVMVVVGMFLFGVDTLVGLAIKFLLNIA